MIIVRVRNCPCPLIRWCLYITRLWSRDLQGIKHIVDRVWVRLFSRVVKVSRLSILHPPKLLDWLPQLPPRPIFGCSEVAISYIARYLLLIFRYHQHGLWCTHRDTSSTTTSSASPTSFSIITAIRYKILIHMHACRIF